MGKLRKTPYSVHQWIGNSILPHFDPKRISLYLLEAKIIPKLRTTDTYCHGWYICGFVSGLVIGGGALLVGGGSFEGHLGGGGGGCLQW